MSYLVPDRALGRTRDNSIESYYERAHHHREEISLVTPCSEAVILGEQLLDPSFEEQFDSYGETVLPAWHFTDEWVWVRGSGATLAPPAVVPWSSNAGADWDISTVNPRSGTYHITSVQSPPGNSPQRVEANLRFNCEINVGVVGPVSARVEPGIVVDWQAWVNPTNVAAGRVDMRLRFITDTGSTSPGTFVQNNPNTISNYELRTIQTVAPANAYWVYAEIRCQNEGAAILWDIDDCSLVLS